MVKLIRLGACCLIMHNMIKYNLKKETQIFDWYAANDFKYVNIILNKIANEEPIEILLVGSRDTDMHYKLIDSDIITSHYNHNTIDEFFEIVNRRAKRLLNDVKNNNEILFIRHDHYNHITYEDVEEFFKIIRKMNSNFKFKLLLLSDKIIEHENVINKIYDEEQNYNYIKECYPYENEIFI